MLPPDKPLAIISNSDFPQCVVPKWRQQLISSSGMHSWCEIFPVQEFFSGCLHIPFAVVAYVLIRFLIKESEVAVGLDAEPMAILIVTVVNCLQAKTAIRESDCFTRGFFYNSVYTARPGDCIEMAIPDVIGSSRAATGGTSLGAGGGGGIFFMFLGVHLE